jgi:hypothetical protein
MGMLKLLVRLPLDILSLLAGCIHFAIKGTNSSATYQSMINLYCLTKGYSSDFLSLWISLVRKSYPLPDADGILGNLSGGEVERINNILNDKGYYVFDQKLPEHLCDALLQFALNSECRITVKSDGSRATQQPLIKYNREHPEGLLYVFDVESVINNSDVQGLIADKSLIAIAQAYLNSQPVLDFPSFWWSTAASPEASVEAAQLYHFDMDRIKWLKFFIYLTDVEEKNGPHTFIAGSQKSGGTPLKLLSKGYSRLTDKAVEECYRSKDVISFAAPRGTIIAEDTRGLHKGAHVREGDRLVLQLQFSNCLFGTTFYPVHFHLIKDPALDQMVKAYPRLYSLFQNREYLVGAEKSSSNGNAI